jgi:broad specificity phosphatase PhoE
VVASLIRLILVRHGVTEWNQIGRYQGQKDVALSNAGREQARRVGERLQTETITAAYASDLQRARQTAAIAIDERDVQLQTTPALREMAFGAWEGLNASEASSRYPAEWAAWIRDPVANAPPGGGEDITALHARVRGFFQSVVSFPEREAAQPDWFSYRAAGQGASGPAETILVVSHGGTVRALLAHLFEVPMHLYWRFGIRPASVSILDVYPEGAIAEVIGDTSHLRVPGAELRVPTAESVAIESELSTRKADPPARG